MRQIRFGVLGNGSIFKCWNCSELGEVIAANRLVLHQRSCLRNRWTIRLVWGFLCQGGVTPFWSCFAFHSFVRPAPRAFFRPDRIFPSPSRAAAVKDGASSAPPKACP